MPAVAEDGMGAKIVCFFHAVKIPGYREIRRADGNGTVQSSQPERVEDFPKLSRQLKGRREPREESRLKQSNADARPAWAHSASDPVQGYQPSFKDRPTLVIAAIGGDFVTGMNRGRRDMATPYLREVLASSVSPTCFVPSGPTTCQRCGSVPREKQHTAASRNWWRF
jgi:hypothetical protein